MPEFLAPGVFIEEQTTAVQTIQAVSTSMAGFVGFTTRGPSNIATYITSYEDAVRKFGGITRKSLMMYALAAFFQNGGSRGYVVRVPPSDSVAASCAIQSKITDQQIETGATGTAAFTRSASASLLADHEGDTPLAPTTVNVRWRAAGGAVTNQTLRQRNGSSALVSVSGQALYEGRIDFKATRLVAGADANGGVYYRSVADHGTGVQVTHVLAGASQSLAVTVSGNRITVTLATDGSAVITSTAAQVVAAIAASAAAAALVTATATGTGAGLARAGEVLNLSGIPSIDGNMDALVPGSLVLSWTAGGSSSSINFSGVTTTPTQTQTNVAGSRATIDLRTGRFSLECAVSETPGVPDAGAEMTVSYTPAAPFAMTDDGAGAFPATTILTANGSVSYVDGSYSFTTLAPAQATRSIGAGTDGTVNITVDRAGYLGNEYTVQVVVPSGTAALSARLVGTAITVNLAVTTGTPTSGANTATLIAAAIQALPGVSAAASGTGATEITTAAASATFTGGRDDTRPHNLARVLATYRINAWTLAPTSTGLWGNDLRVLVAGEPGAYVAATATFTSYRVSVQLYDADQQQFQTVETFEELNFNDPANAQYWVDVLNELSEYVTVSTAGADEDVRQLVGFGRSLAIGAGDESTAGQVLSGTLLGAPLAGRSVTLAYTDQNGVARTITDNGFGLLTGSVDATYAAVVSGLAANRIDLSTGQYNVKTLYPVRRGTFVVATYRSAPEEAIHTEDFGDTATGRNYTAGSDGTFTPSTYGRNQISEPTTLSPLHRGVYALSQVDDLLQVVVPDFAGDVTVSQDLADYAESRATSNPSGGDRFIILATPRGLNVQQATDWLQNQFGRRSKYVAAYWPWVKIRDPLSNNRLIAIPPIGHVAGVFARTDATRNVGKAPAGTVDGQLRYVSELEYTPTQGDREYANPRNLNTIRSDRQVGTAVWGCSTLAASSAWRNINAVRLFMFVEKSVFESTHWVVFENNGPGLWARITLQLEGFLSGLFIDGYFAGTTRAQAYSIQVDDANNPAEIIEAGQVVVDVSIAPNKPAKFARFRFSQRSLAA